MKATMKRIKEGGKDAGESFLGSYVKLTDEISNMGFFYGFVSGVLGIMGGLVITTMAGPDDFFSGLVTVMVFVGLWWFVFTIPFFVYVKPRAGPPMPSHYHNCPPLTWFAAGWRDFFIICRRSGDIPQASRAGSFRITSSKQFEIVLHN